MRPWSPETMTRLKYRYRCLIFPHPPIVKQEKVGKLMIEVDDAETKSRFGAGAVVGCPLLCVQLELLRKGLSALSHF